MKKIITVLTGVLIIAGLTAESAHCNEEQRGVCSLSDNINRGAYRRLVLDAMIRRNTPEIAQPFQLGLEFSLRFGSLLGRAQIETSRPEAFARFVEVGVIAPLNAELKARPPGKLDLELHLIRLKGSVLVQSCSYPVSADRPIESQTCLSVELKSSDQKTAWESEAKRASWAPEKLQTEDEYVQAKSSTECRALVSHGSHGITDPKIDDSGTDPAGVKVMPLGECLPFPRITGLGASAIE